VTDFPYAACIKKAQGIIDMGHDVYQLFTCERCNKRVAIEEANTFHERASCPNCGKINDIRKRGCNYRTRVNVRAGMRSERKTA
jgi:predicted RNA-binding Zn-ribbon protein involved in translation (DUF1610 family)